MNYQQIYDALDRSETLLNDLFQTPEEKKAHLELLTDIARSKDQVKDFIDGRSIAAIWSVEDVMQQGDHDPDFDSVDDDEEEKDESREITEDDAINILGLVDKHHDASVGINWEVIQCHTDMYFEEKDKDATVTVFSSNGNLEANRATGEVVGIEMFPDGEGIDRITKFDFEEYRQTYGSIPTGGIDILDLGYWQDHPEFPYVEPEKDWRKEFRDKPHF